MHDQRVVGAASDRLTGSCVADGEVLPGHRWRVVDRVEHAFSIFRNRPDASHQTSMCGQVVPAVNVQRGTAPRCLACIQLARIGA